MKYYRLALFLITWDIKNNPRFVPLSNSLVFNLRNNGVFNLEELIEYNILKGVKNETQDEIYIQ